MTTPSGLGGTETWRVGGGLGVRITIVFDASPVEFSNHLNEG